MSNLPPYSTFRTDSKQMMFPQATSHGNILTFTPPGFRHSLNVKFPDSRLAVCEKCKKNFKTRDMCRVRNAHTAAPWTTAFICITLDASCTDENGLYVDKPLTVRMVQWQPYCVRATFDPKTPVCAACKKTNRTRSFCRERHKHRQLPWCTVYVLLSALDQADPTTVVAAPSKLVDNPEGASGGAETTPRKGGDNEEGKTDDADSVKHEHVQGTPAVSESFDSAHTTIPTSDESKSDKKKSSEEDDGDDINDIAESRTFLAKVSGESTTIHWLELAEYDAAEASQFPGYAGAEAVAMAPMNPAAMQGMDPNQAQYYAYAAQQHQRALKTHQQYYFQMHQHNQQHQYAAQQAAWQAHYQGQPVPVPAQPHNVQQLGAPPPPPPPPPPHMVHQQQGHPPPHQQQGHPPPPPPPPPPPHGHQHEAPTSPPVTAGEAAAQRRRLAAQPAAPPPTAPAPPAPSAGEAAAAARARRQQEQQQQEQQQHQQQQQWQMYQQPMYAPPGAHPPPPHYSPHTAPQPYAYPGHVPIAAAPSPTNAPQQTYHHHHHPEPQHHYQPPPQQHEQLHHQHQHPVHTGESHETPQHPEHPPTANQGQQDTGESDRAGDDDDNNPAKRQRL